MQQFPDTEFTALIQLIKQSNQRWTAEELAELRTRSKKCKHKLASTRSSPDIFKAEFSKTIHSKKHIPDENSPSPLKKKPLSDFFCRELRRFRSAGLYTAATLHGGQH